MRHACYVINLLLLLAATAPQAAPGGLAGSEFQPHTADDWVTEIHSATYLTNETLVALVNEGDPHGCARFELSKRYQQTSSGLGGDFMQYLNCLSRAVDVQHPLALLLMCAMTHNKLVDPLLYDAEALFTAAIDSGLREVTSSLVARDDPYALMICGILYMNKICDSGDGLCDEQAVVHAASEGLTYRADGDANLSSRGQDSQALTSKASSYSRYQIAAACFYRAADRGVSEAQFNLGGLYFFGAGVPQDDRRAFDHISRAAKLGSTAAVSALGRMYMLGHCVAQDSKKAIEHYHQGARQGCAKCDEALGRYYYGRRRGRDISRALGHFRKAAAQNYPYSTYLLGRCAARGYGMKKDTDQAAAYFHHIAQNAEKMLFSDELAECDIKHVRAFLEYYYARAPRAALSGSVQECHRYMQAVESANLALHGDYGELGYRGLAPSIPHSQTTLGGDQAGQGEDAAIVGCLQEMRAALRNVAAALEKPGFMIDCVLPLCATTSSNHQGVRSYTFQVTHEGHRFYCLGQGAYDAFVYLTQAYPQAQQKLAGLLCTGGAENWKIKAMKRDLEGAVERLHFAISPAMVSVRNHIFIYENRAWLPLEV